MSSAAITSKKARASRLMYSAAASGIATLGLVGSAIYFRAYLIGHEATVYTIITALGAMALYLSALLWISRAEIREYHLASAILQRLTKMNSSAEMNKCVLDLKGKYRATPLIASEIRKFFPKIQAHLKTVEAREEAERDAESVMKRRADVKRHFAELRRRIPVYADSLYQKNSAVQADKKLTANIALAEEVKVNIQRSWDDAHSRMSWWQKLNHEQPDFREIDRGIAAMEAAQKCLSRSGFVNDVRSHLDSASALAKARLDSLEVSAAATVPSSHRAPYDGQTVAKSALFFSALSVPVSIWSDMSRAGDVYDVLRKVNGNYAHLSDTEIWLQSLMLSSSSLQGLVSLTKGAYFETLVADQTGGAIFAQFNHPDTDIVIDGVAYQIKATDSVAYINTVPDEIPVIATSEVAQASGAIDGGITNADLEHATGLALGGSVVDVSDTASDAVLVNFGGLGILATIKGIGHAAQQFNSGRGGEAAIIEGIEVAVVGTAKSLVDTAELGYKVATSRPSRFIGRGLLKLGVGAVNALDRQIEKGNRPSS